MRTNEQADLRDALITIGEFLTTQEVVTKSPELFRDLTLVMIAAGKYYESIRK